MRRGVWTCGMVAVAITVGLMALPAPAGAHPSPLNSLTLDFIVDQSGLVVIDGAANRDTYDDAPSPAERAVITEQVVDALRIPPDTVQVDSERSDLYHEVGFRISLHQPFSNDPDGGVRIDTAALQPIAASLGTLTLDVCRVASPGLVLAADASAPSTSPDPNGAGAPGTDRADCRTWVLHGDDAPVVVTTRVTTTGDYVPVPAGARACRAPVRRTVDRGSVVRRRGRDRVPGPHVAGSATGVSSSHLLVADTVLEFTTRTRVDLVVPKAQVGHLSFGADDRPRASRRLTLPECKYDTGASVDGVGDQVLGGPGGMCAGDREDSGATRTVRFPVGARC